jgi:hypothetical protein
VGTDNDPAIPARRVARVHSATAEKVLNILHRDAGPRAAWGVRILVHNEEVARSGVRGLAEPEILGQEALEAGD